MNRIVLFLYKWAFYLLVFIINIIIFSSIVFEMIHLLEITSTSLLYKPLRFANGAIIIGITYHYSPILYNYVVKKFFSKRNNRHHITVAKENTTGK